MKLVFFHNTIPEYRYRFFNEISNIADTKFVISDFNLSKATYGNNFNRKELNNLFICNVSDNTTVIDAINVSDFVIIQPPDSFKEIILAYREFVLAKKFKKRTALFWEKWNPPKKYKSNIHLLKEKIHDIVVIPLVRNVDVCLASGILAKKYFVNLGVKEDNVQIVGDCSSVPGCDYEDLREKYSISNDDFVFLYLGRLIERKGIMVLLEAFNNLKKDSAYEHSWLVIGGDGPLKENAEKYCATNKISNVVFTGFVEQKLRQNYFMMCNAFVLPSYFYGGITEAWGLTINEAMYFGKPVLATTACGSAFDLINDKTGIMVEQDNIIDLQEALKSMCIHKYSAEEIVKFITNYSEKSVAINMAKVLEEFVK